jgi:dTDP-4-dehydrorhamnose reductase
MKVFITGKGGQLGQALLNSRPQDIDLVAFDRCQFDISDSRAC